MNFVYRFCIPSLTIYVMMVEEESLETETIAEAILQMVLVSE